MHVARMVGPCVSVCVRVFAEGQASMHVTMCVCVCVPPFSQAPPYIPPAGPTPELEGLDWEVTSLVRDNTPMLIPPQQQQAPNEPQAVAEGHEAVSQPAQGAGEAAAGTADVGGKGAPALSGEGVSAASQSGLRRGEDGGGEFGWAGVCGDGGGGGGMVMYVRNPDAPSESSSDEDARPC